MSSLRSKVPFEIIYYYRGYSVASLRMVTLGAEFRWGQPLLMYSGLQMIIF